MKRNGPIAKVIVAAATIGALCCQVSAQAELQPKVTVVEKGKLVHGSVSMDKGSPWCEAGQRMFWLVGHDFDDHPSCEVSPGNWVENESVELPLAADSLNARDDAWGIDRHDCKPIYADADDKLDIICLVGANKGRGDGYNELYLTQPDGTLSKILTHGLQKYTTLRTRMMNTLRGRNGEQLVFIAARGTERLDGKPNVHLMFRVTRGQPPYFEEVVGPWKQNTVATQVKVGDIDGDGLDDIIVTNEKTNAFMLIQQSEGDQFRSVSTAGSANARGVRIEDVTGDGIADVVLTKGYRWDLNGPFLLQIFKGTGQAPYFNFNSPDYELQLDYPSGDVEVMDVNGDGKKDLYVVQADEANRATNSYCGNENGSSFNPRKWYNTGGFPPVDFVAPLDMAADLILLGTGESEPSYDVVEMNHRIPGCGFLAQKFGNDQTMILSHGEVARAGNNVVLEWPVVPVNSEPTRSPSPTLPPTQVPESPPTPPPTPPPTDDSETGPFDTIVVLNENAMVRTWQNDHMMELPNIDGFIEQTRSGLVSVTIEGRVVWTNGYSANRQQFHYTIMQADGNCVTRSMANQNSQTIVWETGRDDAGNGSNRPYKLAIISRTTIAVLDGKNHVIWSDRLLTDEPDTPPTPTPTASPTPPPTRSPTRSPTPDNSEPGSFDPIVVLNQNAMVRTWQNDFMMELPNIDGFIEQTRAGLVSVTVEGRVVWTNGYSANMQQFHYTIMQADGNLITRSMANRNSQTIVWETGRDTAGNGSNRPYKLVINTSTTIAVLDGTNKVIWSDDLLETL